MYDTSAASGRASSARSSCAAAQVHGGLPAAGSGGWRGAAPVPQAALDVRHLEARSSPGAAGSGQLPCWMPAGVGGEQQACLEPGGASGIGLRDCRVQCRLVRVADEVQTGHQGGPDLLHSTKTVHSFLCARGRIPLSRHVCSDAAGSHFGEEGDANGETSEVVLAFPLGPSQDGAQNSRGRDGATALDSCAVYAFLPVYAAGLKFAVHADFDLVASRQNLRHDSTKNLALREAVARVFVAAVSLTRADARLAGGHVSGLPGDRADETGRILQGGLQRYLPTESAITCPFFKPLAHQVRELLRQHACVETEAGNLRRPAEVYIRLREVPVELLSSQELLAATGFEFAHLQHQHADTGRRLREAQGAPPSEAAAEEESEVAELMKLGCKKLTANVVLDCLESGVMALVTRPQQWYWRLFAFLLDHLHDDVLLHRLFCLAIFRVSTRVPRSLAAARGEQNTAEQDAEPEMAALCQSSLFLAVPPDLAADGAVASGALRILCDEVHRACLELLCHIMSDSRCMLNARLPVVVLPISTLLCGFSESWARRTGASFRATSEVSMGRSKEGSSRHRAGAARHTVAGFRPLPGRF